VQKSCEFCGKPFNAQRLAAKFCSATCRQRRKRAGAAVVSLAASNDQPEAVESSLASVTRRVLESAKVLETVPGQAALILAGRIEAGNDTGAAIAAMTKQLEASVEKALSSAKSKSWLDQLRDERDDIYGTGGA